MNMILSRHQASILCCVTLSLALLCYATQNYLTCSPHFFVIMKPGLELIDMEEDNPGGLLNHGHAEDELESWECPPILIENDVGKDPINISDVFKYSAEGQWMEKKCDKIKNNIGIRLPAAVYPPDWNAVDHVREKIIQHARLSSVELVKFKVEKKIRKQSHQHFVLRCKFGRKSAPAKPFEVKEGTAPHVSISEQGVPCAQYKPGIRRDPMQNKAQGIRGTKGEGKKLPRRSNTEKPDEEHGEQVCPVQFKVCLIPGDCWCMPHQPLSHKMHCGHERPERGEMGCRASHLSEDQKKTVKILEEHVGTGSQSQNIMKEVTDGFHIPTSVMQTVSTNPEDKNKSSATLLIEHLNRLVALGEVRYVALYHTVTETSLLAVGKAQEREELLKKKIAEAALLKENESLSEGDVPTLTDEELRELAGDLLKEGGLKMYHTGRLKKKDNPVEIMVNKMQEMLDFGSTLSTVKESLQVGLCCPELFVA